MTDLISEIDAIFHSRSLAIYGVSRKGGLGNILLQGFIDQEFPKIFIVNPRITKSNVKIMGIQNNFLRLRRSLSRLDVIN